MLFKLTPQIFKEFKNVRIGLISALSIDNTKTPDAIKKLLVEQQKIVKEKLNLEILSKHEHILAWHEAYKKFGAKPKEHLSSHENLVRRVLKGQEIKSINTLVDLYNYISLKYLIPVGAEDLDRIEGDIELIISSEVEKPVILLGEKEARAPKKGEVIYKDKNGAICRRWNWKEAERTKVTKNTKNAIIILEALDIVDSVILEAATEELADLIRQYCAGLISLGFIDENKPSVVLRDKTEYIPLNTEWHTIHVSFDIYKPYKEDLEIDHQEHGSAEHLVRLEKVKRLKEKSIEPWPERKEVTANTKQIIHDFDKDGISREYAISGRILTIRFHGKTVFADLQDHSGKIQIYIRQDIVGDDFDFFKEYIDIGDIIWCHGSSFKTKLGEITLKVNEFKLLSKCLYPLPEKFHGLADIEIKYRQRYLDLITNPDVKERFIKRSEIIREIRNFLDTHNYIEVETPMLHPIAGGATARPFITHHNALNSDFYLRIAPELYLKRLVVGGMERVYEINRNFRNEGISTKHNPEFTMLEFYTAHKDYHFAMNFVEELIRAVANKVCHNLKLPFGDYLIDWSLPFERLSPRDAVKLHANLTDADLDPKNIDKTVKKNCVKFDKPEASQGEKIFALFEELVEPKLIQPTFIIDFPIEISPLSKRDKENPEIAARFELFVASMEISNGFNELNDPFDQAQRFYDQLKAHRAGDLEAHQFDKDYIKALEYGLPPTVGVGIGIDRLVMLLTNTQSIKEVILFPTLKKKE